MLGNLKIRWLIVSAAVLFVFLSTVLPAHLLAQDSDDDTPLGDVARNFRKKSAPSQDVIDNDNLSKVMDDAESHRLSGSSLSYSFDKLAKNFQVSAPDVTCSLSFSANAKALLSSPYVQADLPPSEVFKLKGPATIVGDTLQVALYNGTEWHVSELAVALTILKKADSPEVSVNSDATEHGPAGHDMGKHGTAKLVPTADREPVQEPENESQKKPDVTLLFRMRAAAAPAATAVFTAPLNFELFPDQEWHWAIVQAKGYPPQWAVNQSAQAANPSPIQPLTDPLATPAADIPQGAAPPPQPQAQPQNMPSQEQPQQ